MGYLIFPDNFIAYLGENNNQIIARKANNDAQHISKTNYDN